jgi:hypothetical protein
MREHDGDIDIVKLFLVADPEIRNYKVLTYEDMRDLVSEKKNMFDMMNLSPFQNASFV